MISGAIVEIPWRCDEHAASATRFHPAEPASSFAGMGDRASYAIREEGTVELFYGQFGAVTLLADIFWGPTTCEAMIRAQAPSDRWLDDVFGEAAVALCKDTRTVAFYDCRYADETR